jgi:hypothetical protein
MIVGYIKKQEEFNEEWYQRIEEFCSSKLFKGFGILQLVAFLHFNRENKKTRHKDAFIIYALIGLYRAINDTIDKVVYGWKEPEEVPTFDIEFIVKNITIEYKDEVIRDMNRDKWNFWRDKKCRSCVWYLINKLLDILKDLKLKGYSETDPIDDLKKYQYIGFVDGAFNINLSVAGYGWFIMNNQEEMIAED